MVMIPDARLPDGFRVYAIGDVHGMAGLLAEAHARIEADLARRPVADWRVVHLGDLIDRGPDSAGALGQALARAEDPRWITLRGNHEQYLIDFLADPETGSLGDWLSYGGREALASFGIEIGAATFGDAGWRRRLWERARQAVPERVQRQVAALPLSFEAGDFLFVHAGIRPGVPIARQKEADLIWIREPFLSSPADHGRVVVHGHTPVHGVLLRPNRIGIDTGAVFGRELTCLIVEGDARARLTGAGPEPLGLAA